jgi:hypothetical protein
VGGVVLVDAIGPVSTLAVDPVVAPGVDSGAAVSSPAQALTAMHSTDTIASEWRSRGTITSRRH